MSARADTPTAFLTVGQVAEHLRTSAMTVHRAIDRGDLVAFRDGRVIRISQTALDAYVAAKTGGDQLARRRRRRSA